MGCEEEGTEAGKASGLAPGGSLALAPRRACHAARWRSLQLRGLPTREHCGSDANIVEQRPAVVNSPGGTRQDRAPTHQAALQQRQYAQHIIWPAEQTVGGLQLRGRPANQATAICPLLANQQARSGAASRKGSRHPPTWLTSAASRVASRCCRSAAEARYCATSAAYSLHAMGGQRPVNQQPTAGMSCTEEAQHCFCVHTRASRHRPCSRCSRCSRC